LIDRSCLYCVPVLEEHIDTSLARHNNDVVTIMMVMMLMGDADGLKDINSQSFADATVLHSVLAQ